MPPLHQRGGAVASAIVTTGDGPGFSLVETSRPRSTVSKPPEAENRERPNSARSFNGSSNSADRFQPVKSQQTVPRVRQGCQFRTGTRSIPHPCFRISALVERTLNCVGPHRRYANGNRELIGPVGRIGPIGLFGKGGTSAGRVSFHRGAALVDTSGSCGWIGRGRRRWRVS